MKGARGSERFRREIGVTAERISSYVTELSGVDVCLAMDPDFSFSPVHTVSPQPQVKFVGSTSVVKEIFVNEKELHEGVVFDSAGYSHYFESQLDTMWAVLKLQCAMGLAGMAAYQSIIGLGTSAATRFHEQLTDLIRIGLVAGGYMSTVILDTEGKLVTSAQTVEDVVAFNMARVSTGIVSESLDADLGEDSGIWPAIGFYEERFATRALMHQRLIPGDLGLFDEAAPSEEGHNFDFTGESFRRAFTTVVRDGSRPVAEDIERAGLRIVADEGHSALGSMIRDRFMAVGLSADEREMGEIFATAKDGYNVGNMREQCYQRFIDAIVNPPLDDGAGIPDDPSGLYDDDNSW